MKLLFALLACMLFASVAFATSFAVVQNTEYCLGTCQTVFEVTPTENITIPGSADASYYFDFFKDGQPVEFSSYSFEMLRQTEEQLATPIVVEAQHIVPKDANISDCAAANLQELDAQNCYYTSQELDHYEYSTVQKQEWVPFAYWGQTLEAGKTYKIRLTGTRNASLGNYSLQLKSSFGSSPAEPQSWAGGWMHRKIVKVKNNYGGILDTNNAIAIDLMEDFDLQQCYLSGECQEDGDDLRLSYQENEIPYFIEFRAGEPRYLWFRIQDKIPALGVDGEYYLYYANPSAVTPHYTVELPLPAVDSYTYALYRFDEGNGNKAEEISGKPYFNLFQVTWEDSPWGKAARFNGTGYSYSYTNAALYEPAEEATVEIWMNLDSLPSGFPMPIVGNTPYGETGGYMFYHLDGTFYLRLFPGDNQISKSADIEMNKWNHFAASWGEKGRAILMNGKVLQEGAPNYPGEINYYTVMGTGSRNFLPPPGDQPGTDGAFDELRISTIRRTIFPQPEINSIGVMPSILSLETSPDEDSDGVEDWADECLATPEGEEVSLQGCSCSQLCVGWGNPCYDNTCNLNQNACTSVIDNTNTCGIEKTCGKDSCLIKPYSPYWYWEDWTASGHDYCLDGQCISYECQLLSSDYNSDCDPTTGLQNRVNELETENSSLKSRLGIVETENEEQDQNISGQGQQIGALGTENLQQSSRIGSLEQENTEQSSDINSLVGENSGLAARILGLEALAAQQSAQIAGILAEITGINASIAALQEAASYLSDQVDFITWLLNNRLMGNTSAKYNAICDWMEETGQTQATIFGSQCTIANNVCSCAEV